MAVGDSITAFGQSLAQRGKQLAVNAANQAIGQVRNAARNAVNNAVNQGLSYVPAPLRGIARGIVNDGLSSLGLGGGAGGSMYSEPEDFNKLRQINKKLVKTEFVHEWDFRLKIEKQPADFDLYVKDLSYGAFETGTDEEKFGSATYTYPVTDQPVRISFTARDNYDLRIAKYIHGWAGMITGPDGTVGLPFGEKGYLRFCEIFHVKSNGEEVPLYKVRAYPIQFGDCTRSHENCAFMEMPVTLVAFSTLYYAT